MMKIMPSDFIRSNIPLALFRWRGDQIHTHHFVNTSLNMRLWPFFAQDLKW